MLRIIFLKIALVSATLVCDVPRSAQSQDWRQASHPWAEFGQISWLEQPLAENPCFELSSKSGSEGKQNQGEGSGDLAGDATNPTANVKVFQIQNSFIPNTYEASGFAHTLSLQAVLPFKTKSEFFPTWITRATLPVVTTADPDADIPIGPGNDTDFNIPIDRQSGLGDFVFISVLTHPTDWGSWGVGPGFMAPTATRAELGEQSWKFSPSLVVVNTSIKTWQLGILGTYNFPLDARGSKSFMFQPLIVKQLGNGWYTGWGDDLWVYNSDSGNFAMPLQLRLGKVKKIHEKG